MCCRLLSGVKIDSHESLGAAIQALHERYGVPHVVITSVSLPHPDHPAASLSVVGSTMTSARRPRAFKIVFPAIDAYFCGTGDMFAALMVARMREAVAREGGPALTATASWLSGDEVPALELPLARAAERVLASMHEVLERTAGSMRAELGSVDGAGAGADGPDAKSRNLAVTRAAELRLVRNLDALRHPKVEFRAVKI